MNVNKRILALRLKLNWPALLRRTGFYNSGPTPLEVYLEDVIRSDNFRRWLVFSGRISLIAPFALIIAGAFSITAITLASAFNASGLALDVFGALALFSEWSTSFEDQESEHWKRIDRLTRMDTSEEPWSEEELEAIGAAQVARHMSQGVQEKLLRHRMAAFNGIAFLVIGFSYQLIATIAG